MTPGDTRTTPRRALRFGPLRVAYDERVLEPRPWTLEQSMWAAQLLTGLPDGPLLELCTGAGQIGLAAAALSGRHAVLVDASEAACELAALNAEAAGLAGRVEVRHAPLTQALGPDERFALVLADPPYIPSWRTELFPDDPVSAIDGGHDGLELARSCLTVGARHLPPGGPLLLQLRNEDQADVLTDEPGHDPLLRAVETRAFAARGVVLRLERLSDGG